MANKQDFDTLRTDFRDATSAIAARFEALEARRAGDLSPEEEEEVASEFRGLIDNLKAMGTDPNAPIPPLS